MSTGTGVRQGVDPVTFEVIRHRLWAINDEQAMIATRISPSPVVYEAYDFNSGLLTADGRGLFVGVYIIHHAVPIDIFVNRILELWPREQIREGDMFFTNDPWSGALHHNDGILVSPVFYEGEIVLWTGIVMHDEDVGSPVPGSFVVGARDRFGEAPLIPPVKMVEGFEVRPDVESIFTRNSRRPESNTLNMRARAAALRITHQRVHQLCDQYGKDTFLACQDEIVDYVERVVRRRLLEIPDGEWFEHSYIDHDGNDNELYELRCTLRKQGDRLTIDFTGTSEQAPGAINCARGGLEGASLGVFLIFLCHDLPWSAGAVKRVVDIVSEEGTINNAAGVAGVSMASVMGTWATQNVVSNAFAKMLLSSEKYREEAMACWQPGINGQVIAGVGRRGDPFATVLLDCSGGGAGARTFADGVDSGGFMQSMSATVPNAETTEHRYPVLQIYRRERQDSSGHGRYRGGLGLEYGLLPHKSRGPIVDLVFASGVSQPEGHGLSGGGPAAVASNVVVRNSNTRDLFAAGDMPESFEDVTGDSVDVLAAKETTMLQANDLHILLLSGGGAYGDPLLRDSALVALDVGRGKVTEEDARTIYAVVLQDGAVDPAATEAARAAQRERRLRDSERVDESVGGGTVEGTRLHPVADTLEAVETAGDVAIRCTRCSYRLSGYDEDYKRGTVVRELPITALSPLNARGLVDEIVAREYACPGCGTLVALDVQRASEPMLPEARFGSHARATAPPSGGSTDRGRALLLGSVARPEDGWSVDDVFRRCSELLGDHVSMLPDGELGDRSQWITFVARHVYSRHPDLVTLSRHTFEDWKPRHYDDQWRFAVREGVERVRFPRIGYAEEAKRSYEVFARLRDEGAIRAGVRFLVALPGTESAVRPFVASARDFELLWEGYNEALRNELAELAAAIPNEDLAIQWDLARETAAVEGIEFGFGDASLTNLPPDAMERYCLMLGQLTPDVPGGIWLGLHVCYGSLLHEEGASPDSAHYTPIRDLSVSVEMLNRGVSACGRRVDFVHMPVQLSEKSDAFYRPLADLDVAGARVYLGLVDPSDGVEGALERIALGRRYLPDFGVATPCGWGRRPPSQRPESLLALELAVLEAAGERS